MRKAKDWPAVEATQEIQRPDQKPYKAPLATCMTLRVSRGAVKGHTGRRGCLIEMNSECGLKCE
jgi:hypothetical protein